MKLIFKIIATITAFSFFLNGYAVKAKDYKKVTSQAGVTVVKFWAPWCGNCAAFNPKYNYVKSKFSGIKFIEINTDEVDDSEKTFGLKYGLPTVVIFKDGVELSRLPGGGEIEELTNWINSYK